jgi:N-formylglutamate deformylase
MDLYRFAAGDAPLLVSIPHVGTHLPDAIAADLTPAGHLRADTDWHLDRLYDFAAETGASVLMATHSRYVIDLNRDPGGMVLYPGQDTTELVPRATFAGEPVHAPGREPDAAEIARRVDVYWRPYHDRLRAELDRIRARHGVAVLFDAHSIRSRVPRLFPGRLPDLNLGTRGGTTADAALVQAAMDVLAAAPGFSSVCDGRFRGGFITASCGRPGQGVHALQLEMAQCVYMDEDAPFAYRPERAARIRPTLRALLDALVAWARARG